MGAEGSIGSDHIEDDPGQFKKTLESRGRKGILGPPSTRDVQGVYTSNRFLPSDTHKYTHC